MESTEIDEPVLYSLRGAPKAWGRIVGIERLSDDSVALKFFDASGELLAEAASDFSFFKAFLEMRIALEQKDIAIYCRGCEVDVYPSPMQESMGAPLLAYKNYLGRQALSCDIVKIFECDESIVPATVAEQKSFHGRWLESL